MIRLRVYIDGELRLDEPARAPDIDQLARAVDDLESDCLAYNRRLLVPAERDNVTSIIVRI